MNESVKKLRDVRKRLLARVQMLNTIDLLDLYKLRSELFKLIEKLQALRKEPPTDTLREDVKFLEDFFKEVNKLEIEVCSFIFEKEKAQALHAFWEKEIIPEVISTERATPKFPALADFKVPNLLSLMDDSWLPKKRPDNVSPLNLGVTP